MEDLEVDAGGLQVFIEGPEWGVFHHHLAAWREAPGVDLDDTARLVPERGSVDTPLKILQGKVDIHENTTRESMY